MNNNSQFNGLAIAESLYSFDANETDSKLANPDEKNKSYFSYEEYKRYLRKQNLPPDEYQRRIRQFCKNRGI